MMVDLGKHATEVLLAYGVSLALLALLVWISIRQNRNSVDRLNRAEQDQPD